MLALYAAMLYAVMQSVANTTQKLVTPGTPYIDLEKNSTISGLATSIYFQLRSPYGTER